MIKKHKNKIIVISLLLIGALLIILSSFKTKINKKGDGDYTQESYTKSLETKLEKFLLSVDGVNNVNVIITLDSIYESEKDISSGSLSFFSNSAGNESTLQIYPYVRGVAVSCTNGDNDYVKNKLTRLISAYFGIPSNRIEIVSYG